MKWYVKSIIQNAVELLPNSISQSLYYQLQRNFGELKNPLFSMRFKAAATATENLNKHGDGIKAKSILEIGTGRTIDLPLALWLMGAGRITTVDLNRLLRADLICEAVNHLIDNWAEYRSLFSPHCDNEEMDQRFNALKDMFSVAVKQENLPQVLALLNIDYQSPADGSQLQLEDESIDICMSYVVLQHIPKQPMLDILKENNRVLKKDGKMYHSINTSDHFSHVDPSVSPLRFLCHSERKWHLIAGNDFMYQNRMRADNYYDLFKSAGLSIVNVNEHVGETALNDLKQGLPLHDDWKGNDPERDAVIRFQIVLKKAD